MRILTFTSLLLACFFLLSPSLQAQTYSTLNDGNWDDATNVWSVDGVTPCGCNPGNPVTSGNIHITNNISLTANLQIQTGAVVTIEGTGNLSGVAFSVEVESGSFVVQGAGNVGPVHVHPSGFMVVNGPLTINGDFNIETFTIVNGAVLTVESGNVNNLAGGFLIMQGGTLLHINNGNLTNDEILDYFNACTYITGGHLVNNAFVAGLGGVHVSGDITNNNNWSVTVDWCAAGTDIGLPTAENCLTNSCGGLLPVTYSDLNARFMLDQTVQVEWKTASETNNDHFTVQRSTDGLNFTNLDDVIADASQSYAYTDANPPTGTVFYRLEQQDIDGQTSLSQIVVVSTASTSPNFATVYPNPTQGQLNINYQGESGAPIEIRVYDLTGKEIYAMTETQASFLKTATTSLEGFEPGLYLVDIKQGVETKQFKVVYQ
ncbi:MAG: T9SS type A sorting domain-containing protein [Bacteroidota bacterium]